MHLWFKLVPSWIFLICNCMHGSRGCLGCRSELPLVTSVDAPSKGLKVKGKRVKKHNIAEEFWGTSSGGMDNHNSVFPSDRSILSVSTSNQMLDYSSSAAGTSNHNEFFNNGLLFWNQIRQQWVGSKQSQKSVKAQEPKLSWTTTYESLLGTNKSLPHPIPLSEMVDFLVDVWEQEGLYD